MNPTDDEKVLWVIYSSIALFAIIQKEGIRVAKRADDDARHDAAAIADSMVKKFKKRFNKSDNLN